MNKIFVFNDTVIKKDLDKSVSLKHVVKKESFAINKIEIKVLKDTYLEIEYDSDVKSKLDVVFTIESNASLSLFEKRKGKHTKIHYKYNLKDYSNLFVNKFYDAESIKEMIVVNLNGINSKVDYSFKTISKNEEKYDLIINHNKKNSESNVYNAAVNILDGRVLFNVSAFVHKGVKNCVAHQNGRIINMNNNKCIINPNLYVEDSDVVAEHAAAIGKFSDEEIFYMMSRGIKYDDALNLLIKGFLLPNNDISEEKKEEIKTSIDKYWR